MDKIDQCSPNDYKRKKRLERKLQFDQAISKANTIRTLSETQDYLKERKIFDIFHFLLGHLIVHRPPNPIEYLYQLLDDCILFRSGFKGPRLFWMERHIEAVFQKVSTGTPNFLSENRYKTAMKILGIPYRNICPEERAPGHVDKETFCAEALNSMENEFARIIRPANRRGSPDCVCDTFDV
ncbi:uncharacterized protein LOC114875624 [Osmia bicornis bicornis]|uniref:uncharacterized protein LOC114875624 n=1 Tax=Osmia bicornis bicornis TaxID=1437191 RepID=UPI001EAF4591|nr:uncharacterized protein LOC114875624 [Osmia bicornis bicornis]